MGTWGKEVACGGDQGGALAVQLNDFCLCCKCPVSSGIGSFVIVFLSALAAHNKLQETKEVYNQDPSFTTA